MTIPFFLVTQTRHSSSPVILSEAKKLLFTQSLRTRSLTAFRMTIPFFLVTQTRHSSSQVILSEAKKLLFNSHYKPDPSLRSG
jgi:hypothetical protein